MKVQKRKDQALCASDLSGSRCRPRRPSGRNLAEKKLKRTKSRAYRSAAARQTHGVEQAQRSLQGGLEAAGLAPENLSRVRGSDPRKVSLAELLWSRTTVTQEWLAEKLQMRSAANVSQLLRRTVVKRRNRQVPSGLGSVLI
jgi:hypothetical protein